MSYIKDIEANLAKIKAIDTTSENYEEKTAVILNEMSSKLTDQDIATLGIALWKHKWDRDHFLESEFELLQFSSQLTSFQV